ncbi:hypothetical protein L6164_026114 [Bauhinia variegata]|uniref:Uncharacterized protein n=1 Tax=Bauhinia variegata TaxID=167791 RepID=A0ACB9LP04_BAUVA|nr:hypothetical protein L6164_026114 [Bauhinia variegata]
MLSKPYWSEADEIQQEIMADPHYSKVMTALRNDPDSQIGFSLVQDRLFYKGRLVISKDSKWVPIFLHEFHSSPVGGHSGVLRTYKRLAANLYWPGMMNSVLQFVKDYNICQQSKYEAKSPAGLLQPLPIPKAIWEDISLDFMSGLPKSIGFDAIMVVVDRLTKYGHFICLKHPFTAQTVAALFAKEIVRLHGVPSSIVSDRDPTFVSKFWSEFFKIQGTALKMSTAYHPETDGQTEVLNRGLETYLRCFTSEQPNCWADWLSWAEYWYNTSYQGSTGSTPFELVYGRKPPTILRFLPAATGQLPADPEIPIELEQEIPVVEPEEFLKRNNQDVSQVLVKWKNQPLSEATWEDEVTIRGQFPEISLEDKAVSTHGGNCPFLEGCGLCVSGIFLSFQCLL